MVDAYACSMVPELNSCDVEKPGREMENRKGRRSRLKQYTELVLQASPFYEKNRESF